MPTLLRILTPMLCLLPLALPPAHAQRSKDPLTPAEEDQVREVADQPNERLKLYIKFIEQRTTAIHATVQHPATQHPGADIHNALEEYTRLADELADNLDAYAESHTDARKGLKVLLEHVAKWPPILNEPGPSPEYDFARKTAVDATNSLADEAARLEKEQQEYFGKHKQPKP